MPVCIKKWLLLSIKLVIIFSVTSLIIRLKMEQKVQLNCPCRMSHKHHFDFTLKGYSTFFSFFLLEIGSFYYFLPIVKQLGYTVFECIQPIF